jgi:ribosome-associated translation inhibitor RaiA
MRVYIAGHGVEITPRVRDHIKRRLSFALRPSSGRILRVAVRLDALQAGQHHCRVLVRLAGIPSVVVGQHGPDLFATIDATAGQVGYLVNRRLKRSLAARRGPALRLQKAVS